MRKHDCILSHYQLRIRQQPKQARMAGMSGIGDRRPIDPPPIVQLSIIDPSSSSPSLRQPTSTFLQNPHYFMYASLVRGDGSDEDVHAMQDGISCSLTVGSVVSSLYHLKDLDGSDAAFFTFPDISLRFEGRYKLKFTLFEIVGKEVYYCSSILSDIFIVYNGRDFPGFRESTQLSRSFANQGHKVRIKTEIKIKRRKVGGGENGKAQLIGGGRGGMMSLSRLEGGSIGGGSGEGGGKDFQRLAIQNSAIQGPGQPPRPLSTVQHSCHPERPDQTVPSPSTSLIQYEGYDRSSPRYEMVYPAPQPHEVTWRGEYVHPDHRGGRLDGLHSVHGRPVGPMDGRPLTHTDGGTNSPTRRSAALARRAKYSAIPSSSANEHRPIGSTHSGRYTQSPPQGARHSHTFNRSVTWSVPSDGSGLPPSGSRAPLYTGNNGDRHGSQATSPLLNKTAPSQRFGAIDGPLTLPPISQSLMAMTKSPVLPAALRTDSGESRDGENGRPMSSGSSPETPNGSKMRINNLMA